MARRRFTFAKPGEPFAREASPAWMAACAVVVVITTVVWRLYYSADIPAECAAELEAARRIMGGALPYTQFYSTDLWPLFAFRLMTLMILPKAAPGLASAIATTAILLVSFFSLHRILGFYVKSSHKWLFLIAFALANLAMGFQFGQQQHIFVLMALPYLALRYFEWQQSGNDNRLPLVMRSGTALAAALGAGFSIFYFAAVVFFELSEAIVRRASNFSLTASLKTFVFFSALIWAHLFILTPAQKTELFGWIFPLKYMACTHYDYSYYGWAATPERTDLVYIFVCAMIFAYGGVLRFAVLRPLVVLSASGLFIWMSFVTGLSADSLILTFFLTLLVVVEVYGLVSYVVRTYPRLLAGFSRMALSAFVVVSTAAFAGRLLYTESMQRRQVKTLATRLQPSGVHDMPDLESFIAANSKRGDSIMIINGHLRPAFPVITKLGLSSVGYFIGTEPLNSVQSLSAGRLLLTTRDAAFVDECENKLYSRLENDITACRPTLICLEGGESEREFIARNLYKKLIQRYKRLGEAMYFSERREPREVSEYNYNYWVYKLQ